MGGFAWMGVKGGLAGRACFALLLAAAGVCAQAQGKRGPAAEEGEFSILIGGREIGSEKYVIHSAGDSVTSDSVLEFRSPTPPSKKIRLESRLEMNGKYTPLRYSLKSDVDGKKGTITGVFDPNQAMFEYRSAGTPFRRGLLVSDRYTLLDSNVYHHFIFLARLFDYGSRGKIQKLEVVIPQETDSGVLKMSLLKEEEIPVRGRKRKVRVLQADSGALLIRLWVDGELVLHKIAVPDRELEVVRR